MTSSFPIATVFNVVKEIQTQVKLAQVNRALCKRVGAEMEALEPILTDVSNRAQSFVQQQQEIISKALAMLQKDLETTLELIRCQNKGNDEGKGKALAFKVKRFVMARGVNEQFLDAERNLETAKSTLMFALLNQLGSSASQSSGLNMQQAGGPGQAQQAPLQTPAPAPAPAPAPSPKEDILHVMDTPEYMNAIPLAQQLLREGKSEDAIFANYTLAECHSLSGNADKSVTHLFAAKQAGYKDFEQLDQEPHFNPIRTHPDFVQLRNQIEQEVLSTERWRRLPKAQVDDIMKIFDQYDLDGSGKIDAKEFEVLMARTHPESASNSAQIFQSLDADKSGQIGLSEYLNYMADQHLQGGVPQQQALQQPAPQVQQLQQPPQDQQFIQQQASTQQQFVQQPQAYQMEQQYQQGQSYDSDSDEENYKKDKKDKKREKEEKKKEKKEKKHH